jgi:hypothetical protein
VCRVQQEIAQSPDDEQGVAGGVAEPAGAEEAKLERCIQWYGSVPEAAAPRPPPPPPQRRRP